MTTADLDPGFPQPPKPAASEKSMADLTGDLARQSGEGAGISSGHGGLACLTERRAIWPRMALTPSKSS
jgi:hypothetical protein